MYPERFMAEERASGPPRPAPVPRLVDGPGCTPAAVDEQLVDDGPAVLMATCTPNSQPFWDGGEQRTEHGYQINVLDDGLNILATIELPDWETFRPASAGHRLIEHGWMIRPDARGPESVNGWRAIGSGWVTQVIRT